MSVFLQSTKQTNLLSHKAVADNVIEGAMTDTGVSVYLETDHHFVVCPNATSIVLPKITGAGHEIAVVITNSNEITIAGASSDDIETQIETVSPASTGLSVKGPWTAKFVSSLDTWYVSAQSGFYKSFQGSWSKNDLAVGDNPFDGWFYSSPKNALITSISVSIDSDGTHGTYITPAIVQQAPDNSTQRTNYHKTLATWMTSFTGLGTTAPTKIGYDAVRTLILAGNIVIPYIYTGYYDTSNTTGWGAGCDTTYYFNVLMYA